MSDRIDARSRHGRVRIWLRCHWVVNAFVFGAALALGGLIAAAITGHLDPVTVAVFFAVGFVGKMIEELWVRSGSRPHGTP